MRVREFLKRLASARKNVAAEISGISNGGSLFARGMANEGYAGGYKAALDDVQAMLVHGHPSDQRRYWRDPPRADAGRAALQKGDTK